MISRHASIRLREAMSDTPVVIVQGPRQCGKTTLVRSVATELPYVSLDESIALDAALRKPSAFLAAYPKGLVLDEVQRAPEIFRAIKAEVDRDRQPGKYVLTGSSNVLLLPKLSESLAGRMEVAPLWPLSQAEVAGRSDSCIARLFAGDLPSRAEAFDFGLVGRGGFPEPRQRASAARVRAWFEAYVKALIERDVRDLADIEGLAALPRLLRLLARGVGQTLNISALSRESGLAATTLTRYLSLLEAVFLIRPLAAYQTGLSHRTIKAQRMAFVDVGIAASLVGWEGDRPPQDPIMTAPLLENFVANELQRQADGAGESISLQHFRSIRAYEVPIVAVRPDGKFIAISTTTELAAEPSDFRGLEFLQSIAEDDFAYGLVLHAGTEVQKISDRLAAAPLSILWSE